MMPSGFQSDSGFLLHTEPTNSQGGHKQLSTQSPG